MSSSPALFGFAPLSLFGRQWLALASHIIIVGRWVIPAPGLAWLVDVSSGRALSCVFEPDVFSGWASTLTCVAHSAGEQRGVQERQSSLDRWVLCPGFLQQSCLAPGTFGSAEFCFP